MFERHAREATGREEPIAALDCLIASK